MIFLLGLARMPKDSFIFISTDYSGSFLDYFRHALNVILLSSEETDTQNKCQC